MMLTTIRNVLGGTMRTRTTAAALLLVAALAGCSSSNGSDSKPTATSPTSKAITATPTPSPTPQSALKIGATWTWDSPTDGVSGTITVLDYKQGFKSHLDPKDAGGGDEWAYLELKNCSTKGSFSATADPWTLAYADDTRATPVGFHPVDFPKPEYVLNTTLTEGKCLRGKLGFTVPAGTRPIAAVYAPASVDEQKEWAIPAK